MGPPAQVVVKVIVMTPTQQHRVTIQSENTGEWKCSQVTCQNEKKIK